MSTGKHYKWVMLALVCATYFMAQGTRQIYYSAVPMIKDSFAAGGVSGTQYGLVATVFTLVFGCVAPFAGMAADIFSRKWMIVIGALVFSCGIFLSSFASGIGFLICTYGLVMAVGQAMMPPSNSSLIGQFHVETRGTAFALYQTAIYAGIVAIGSLAGWFTGRMGAEGWRTAFRVAGVVGLVWAVVVAVLLKNTPAPVKSGEKVSVKEGVTKFFTKRSALFLMVALACYFFVTYGFKMWSTEFIKITFPDMPIGSVTFHALIWFYLGAFVGVMLAGRISDRFKAVRVGIRFEMELVGILICIPFILMMAFVSSLPLMGVAMACFGFATGVYDSNLYAALLDVVEPRYRAVSTGLFGLGGCVVGATGATVMGWMSDHFGMRATFASLSLVAVIGAVAIAVARFRYFDREVIPHNS